MTLLLSAGDGSALVGGNNVLHHGVQRLHHPHLHDRHHTPHKG